ncbi:hypothetical protein AB0F15_25255 [Amycolatopsis sp. NPDC026612]|uniref:hypothetical protein n=1 Tax=Amycolatopsis sp. NPDC026612 TaxID=3155466 RepID=UPI0033FB98FC
MVVPPTGEHADYVSIGPREYLDRFLDEYHLTSADVHGKVILRPTIGVGGGRGDDDYTIHESLLRSCGEFLCAGDAEALEFCRGIVEEMVAGLGVTRVEAVARVNRQWSAPHPGGRTPRIWIVGLAMVYHEDAEFWARVIYYGEDYFWRDPGSTSDSLPPAS